MAAPDTPMSRALEIAREDEREARDRHVLEDNELAERLSRTLGRGTEQDTSQD